MKFPVVPIPVIVAPPGAAVTVQVPVAGNPLRATPPVAKVQVGCVIVPITGAGGAVQDVNEHCTVAVGVTAVAVTAIA